VKVIMRMNRLMRVNVKKVPAIMAGTIVSVPQGLAAICLDSRFSLTTTTDIAHARSPAGWFWMRRCIAFQA
jgi:hypothetical protein